MAQAIRDSNMDAENKQVYNSNLSGRRSDGSQEQVQLIQNLSGVLSINLNAPNSHHTDNSENNSNFKRRMQRGPSGGILSNGNRMNHFQNFKQIHEKNRVAGYIEDSGSHSSQDRSLSKSYSDSRSSQINNSSSNRIGGKGPSSRSMSLRQIQENSFRNNSYFKEEIPEKDEEHKEE